VAVIVFVDADDSYRAEIAKELGARGHEVRLHNTGKSALENICKVSPFPDLLVTNLEVGELDGLSLTRSIRESYSPDELPILIESTQGLEDDILAGIEAGASDYIVRPCPLGGLLAKVHVLLKEKNSRKEILEQTAAVEPPSPGELDPPQRNVGPYEILGELGRGGMGIVYRARHKDRDQLVALKLLYTNATSQGKFVARFFREIQILRELANPYVVAVLDSGVHAGAYYLAMELIEGECVKERLKASGPLPYALLLDIAWSVASALDALHLRGLVHRDIKPSNILLQGETSTVKLVDFGLAKRFGDRGLTHTGEALGTPYYLSPEAVRGNEVDIRSDLYSLGVTLYEAALNEKAHKGATAFEVFRSIFYSQVPLLSSQREDIPEDFAKLVAALIHRDLEKRPADPAAALVKINELMLANSSSTGESA